jgi:hypothetical protein
VNQAQPLADIKAQHHHIRLQELPIFRACGVVQLKPERAIAKLYIINKWLVAITKRRNQFVGLLPRGAMAYPPGLFSLGQPEIIYDLREERRFSASSIT